MYGGLVYGIYLFAKMLLTSRNYCFIQNGCIHVIGQRPLPLSPDLTFEIKKKPTGLNTIVICGPTGRIAINRYFIKSDLEAVIGTLRKAAERS